MVHVVAHEAEFAGPCRTQLNMPTKRQALEKALKSALTAFCREHGLGRFS